MMNAEVEKFVLTDNKVLRVHAVDCPSVAHLVRGDRKPNGYGQSDMEVAGQDERGRPLYREVRYEVFDAYSATYITREGLSALSRKYQRCRVCAPDVPEVTKNGHALTRVIKPESLTPDHIGRHFIDVGVLTRVVISGEGYVLEGNAGSAQYPPKATLRYFKSE